VLCRPVGHARHTAPIPPCEYVPGSHAAQKKAPLAREVPGSQSRGFGVGAGGGVVGSVGFCVGCGVGRGVRGGVGRGVGFAPTRPHARRCECTLEATACCCVGAGVGGDATHGRPLACTRASRQLLAPILLDFPASHFWHCHTLPPVLNRPAAHMTHCLPPRW